MFIYLFPVLLDPDAMVTPASEMQPLAFQVSYLKPSHSCVTKQVFKSVFSLYKQNIGGFLQIFYLFEFFCLSPSACSELGLNILWCNLMVIYFAHNYNTCSLVFFWFVFLFVFCMITWKQNKKKSSWRSKNKGCKSVVTKKV